MPVLINGQLIDYSKFPAPKFKADIRDWVEHAVPPPGFLAEILKNDLKRSALLADHEHLNLLGAISRWLYNHAPSKCYGSVDAFDEWHRSRCVNTYTKRRV